MARANLNKSVWLVTNTTTASKYIPKRTRICINWNSPFQTQIYLEKVHINVNIVKQDLLDKKVLEILRREVWKGGYQLVLILVLLGMYFDAVVVFVTSQTLLFRLALAILWMGTNKRAGVKHWYFLYSNAFYVILFYQCKKIPNLQAVCIMHRVALEYWKENK